MRLVYFKVTYEELDRPMPGRAGGRPITAVSRQALSYDAETQAHLDMDEAVNADLCADLMARAWAYYIDADGDLAMDPDWHESLPAAGGEIPT